MNTFCVPVSTDQAASRFRGKVISIPVRYIVAAAYLYMVLPIALFCAGWLRWYVGIPAAIALLIGYVFINRKGKDAELPDLKIPVVVLLVSLFILIGWLFSSSYFFCQTYDQNWRNAVFRDLINYKWPVISPITGDTLCYYFMQWIVPAFVGKLVGFTAANGFLVLWNATGVYLVLLLVYVYLRPKTNLQAALIPVLFLLWGGLYELGYLLVNAIGLWEGDVTGSTFTWALEWYRNGYHYCSNDGYLAWLYNQTIVPWLGAGIFLLQPKVKNYAFLGLCVLPYGPFAFCGFCVFLFVDFFTKMRTDGTIATVKSAFSVQNILAAVTIFPIFLLFYTMNSNTQNFGFYPLPIPFGPKYLFYIILFYLIEFGVYCILIHRDYKGSTLFWTVVVSLMIAPHIQLGGYLDFSRCAIPGLLILMAMSIRSLFLHGADTGKSVISMSLVVCFVISALSPLQDWSSRIRAVHNNGWRPVRENTILTMINRAEALESCDNFVVSHPEQYPFFKYLAKADRMRESKVILSESNIHLEQNSESQSIAFPITIQEFTIYRLDLELSKNFDFSAVASSTIDFCLETYDTGDQQIDNFLQEGQYSYTFYFDSLVTPSPSFDCYARMFYTPKEPLQSGLNIERFTISEIH